MSILLRQPKCLIGINDRSRWVDLGSRADSGFDGGGGGGGGGGGYFQDPV